MFACGAPAVCGLPVPASTCSQSPLTEETSPTPSGSAVGALHGGVLIGEGCPGEERMRTLEPQGGADFQVPPPPSSVCDGTRAQERGGSLDIP